MDTAHTFPIVVSHDSALRAIRSHRRRYTLLPWDPLSNPEQHALYEQMRAAGPIRQRAIDFGHLIRLGAWDGSGPLDLMVPAAKLRSSSKRLHSHVLSEALPPGSIWKVENDLYAVSPSLATIQYAETHAVWEVLALIMELAGTFTLQENHVPEASATAAYFDLYAHEQTGYLEAKPVLSIGELAHLLDARLTVRGSHTARKAANYALVGARSPSEAIMDAIFHLPFSQGGFGIEDLRLNYRIYFSEQARAASGMPYAVCDAYIPSAHATLEYNGAPHDAPFARIHDEKRSVGLEAMHIQTFPINHEQLRNIEALEAIARTLYQRAGKRYRNRTRAHRVKQVELLNALRCAFGLRPC